MVGEPVRELLGKAVGVEIGALRGESGFLLAVQRPQVLGHILA